VSGSGCTSKVESNQKVISGRGVHNYKVEFNPVRINPMLFEQCTSKEIYSRGKFQLASFAHNYVGKEAALEEMKHVRNITDIYIYIYIYIYCQRSSVELHKSGKSGPASHK
jgi:hypothetical protein